MFYVIAAVFSPFVAIADVDLDFISASQNPVVPSALVTFTVQGDTDDDGPHGSADDDWRSTRVTIEIPGPNNDITACENDPDVQSNTNNAQVQIALNAPANDGDYVVEGTGYRSPNCNNASGSKQMILHVVSPPPPPVDVCPNIEGNQEVVPEGMELVEGQCVEIVVEPVDACPNVNGVQESGPCADTLCESPAEWSTESQQCVAPETEPEPEPENGGGSESPVPHSFGGGGGMCNPNTGWPECQGAANFAYFGVPAGQAAITGLYMKLIPLLQQIINLL